MCVSDVSFGDQIPEEFREIPILNYIRPATPNHPVKVLLHEPNGSSGAEVGGEATHYRSFKTRSYSSYLPYVSYKYYKYDRTSPSKFIDLSLANLPEGISCFLDDQPIVIPRVLSFYTKRGMIQRNRGTWLSRI